MNVLKVIIWQTGILFYAYEYVPKMHFRLQVRSVFGGMGWLVCGCLCASFWLTVVVFDIII